MKNEKNVLITQTFICEFDEKSNNLHLVPFAFVTAQSRGGNKVSLRNKSTMEHDPCMSTKEMRALEIKDSFSTIKYNSERLRELKAEHRIPTPK